MVLRFITSCMISSAVLIGATITPSVARPAMTAEMYKVLKQNPYTLEMGKDPTLKDFGKLCAAQKCYEIGVWVWKTSKHRAQRILVFEIKRNTLIYLGGYGINTPPLAIVGPKITFAVPKDDGNEIEFDASGPPSPAWVDGENPALFK